MRKPTTALITTLDGTMYMVDRRESGSMEVIWSFSTGAPIYYSYKAPIKKDIGKENVSAALISGFVECGEDWALYMHDKHFGKKRISESIAEYVARTPTFSDDGAVTLGSKRSTLIEVDAKTGRILQNHAMSDFEIASDAVMLSSPDLPLRIFRTDYSLQSVDPSSGIVWWTVTVAEFEAQEIQVFRLQKNILLEPSILQRLPGDDMLSMLTSALMVQVQPNTDGFFSDHGDSVMIPDTMPNSLPSLQRKISIYKNVPPQPLMELTTHRDIYLTRTNKWSTPLSLTLFLVFLFGLLLFYRLVVKKQAILKDQNNEAELQISRAKKKKARKSGKKNDMVGKVEKHMSLENEDVMTPRNNDMTAWLQFNQVDEGVDGRKIGKLLVSNKEIAKGSNGTILLEGIYEGRAVAVKRLVKAHHNVASKEIQNLIVSDRHPNIVRWHGVEHDQDFIYLALERCTCSLYNLVQFYSDVSENSEFMEDQGFKCLIKAQMEAWKDTMQGFWKANGYPSPLLLKLMRDVVSGIVHLHELGIIHRDLKPQNVLIIKEKSLCAKLSDMGISKRLLEDASSLGHNATGSGSSGWQAPEQLVQGRQTRAVDLFGLGCVLFFCLTRGRHPFGERLERDANVVKNKKDLSLVESIPEAKDLISRLLNPDADLRPKTAEVLHHPFFWSSEMRLSFLRDTSDRVELECRQGGSNLLKALQSIATVTFGAKWDKRLEPAFLSNIGHYRQYKFNSVRDLLRVIRNKQNHYGELPHGVQKLMGSVPEGFNDYFASRFPRLLIEVHKVICKYCKEEECFERYFKNVD